MVHQEIAFEGEPVWVPGLGLRFVLPRAYDRCAWTRRGGVLSDYPNDHPDRMTGRTRLDEDEYPPINPFRAPSSSALLVVRNAGVVVLYSERYPALRLEAQADGQRCVVNTRADGSREVHLLLDAYCRPPYQEFSYLRADDAARELCGLRPVEGTIEQTWRLSVHTDARF
jgi:hypothetical protein